jgi:uncharacterized protein
VAWVDLKGEHDMGAPVAFFEFISNNPARIRLLHPTFGWTAAESGHPQHGEQAGRTTIYLQAYLDKAERLGGKTVLPPSLLPGDWGSFAVFADPDGHPVGLWALSKGVAQW